MIAKVGDKIKWSFSNTGTYYGSVLIKWWF